MRALLPALVAALFVFSTEPPAFGERYFDQRERGWFWYEPFSSQTEKTRPGTSKRQLSVKEIRQRGEKLFETALLSPTRENVRAYMEHQKEGA